MSGPLPSHLVLLSELATCEPGQKVRFLGCIEEYITRTATLRLKHDYPPSSSPYVANVNIAHVLERIKRHELEVGSWINIIGSMERRKEKGIYVQAIAVWDAGNMDLDAYQKAVDKRREAG
ncbi:CST complex subunit Ten1 [Massariosphaeria phaeospora]|uniref:CST complex subunit Ten1 n=1 Tax=Massariosphaeria phaeospora TaxID=100035 RepID=A0A7C8I9P6_9PLEO|nr:CST complex subunit Ten1 [Massariosphaeria phaeospora]